MLDPGTLVMFAGRYPAVVVGVGWRDDTTVWVRIKEAEVPVRVPAVLCEVIGHE